MLASFITMVSQTSTDNTLKLLTTETQFEAGANIVLKFSSSNGATPLLYCSNSHGAFLIEPIVKNNTLHFEIPKNIANKTGLINWKLLADTEKLSGTFFINPKQYPNTMETYLGPPTIEAGGTDYTMLVVIPTDVYDNPLKDSTQVNVKHQFLTSEYQDIIYTDQLVAHINLHSEAKTGRMLISSETLDKNSKEYVINVLPAIPTNFNITYEQNHNYADGNQITTFLTSEIRDKNGNMVSDGTLVTFFITNKNKNILKTSAPTINGLATAKMVHPDYGDTWMVKAYIEGMAESNNTLSFDFKQIITDYKVVFSNNNRTIVVGPLQSFMEQMIPDGLQVKLHIYKDNTKVETILKESFEGFVTFKLDVNEIPSNTYKMVVETAKIEKTFENIKL
ncbi:hypothetical protein C1H87_02455 [Flavivirga eckloniae]|uniref:Uncharacterized protein n=2 Tax=Flavivirga eckloniae TaxID=1803846 RepID=A0A2K9PXF6_9FLAO|nr:hypothetical protein C1H87_02455 [Flavivirga eckloniae]